VPDHLIRHFSRGYFDGDGTINCSATGRHKNPQYTVGICGTYNFCQNLNDILVESINFKKSLPAKTESKVFVYSFGGNERIKSFYHYIYDDANLFLTRKKEKMSKVFDLIPYITNCDAKYHGKVLEKYNLNNPDSVILR